MAGDICASITELKDFLRLSRSLVDDRITTQLNNLVLPRRFDPASTRHAAGAADVPVARVTPVDAPSCAALVDTIFANWAARDETIERCSAYATNQAAHTATSPSTSSGGSSSGGSAKPSLNTAKWHGDERRYDPYAKRASAEAEEPILLRVCRGESGTEQVVRDRTWRIIRSRCADAGSGRPLDADWQMALLKWRMQRQDNCNEQGQR